LVGTTKAARVERRAETHHNVEIVGGEEQGHEVDFLNPYPVLAGNASTAAKALFQNFVTGAQYALDLLSIPFIEKEDRVDVAVTCMKNIGDTNVVRRTNALDLAQNVRQVGPRHDPILSAIAWREPSYGPKGLLTAFPKGQSLGICSGSSDFPYLI